MKSNPGHIPIADDEPVAGELIEDAKIGPLTGLPNRRALDERPQQEWARCLRTGGHLSVVMADIDHFKRINDQFGHPAGDEVLRQVARLLGEGCRESDTPARYGVADNEGLKTPEELVQAADQAIYRAKSAGRNCVKGLQTTAAAAP